MSKLDIRCSTCWLADECPDFGQVCDHWRDGEIYGRDGGDGDWITCKCGEELEAPLGRAVCPSCGRTVIAE